MASPLWTVAVFFWFHFVPLSAVTSELHMTSTRTRAPHFLGNVGKKLEELSTIHMGEDATSARQPIPKDDDDWEGVPFIACVWSSSAILMISLWQLLRKLRRVQGGLTGQNCGTTLWVSLNVSAASTQRPPGGCDQALPFRGHAEDVLQVVASWDGGLCASSSLDGIVCIWNTATGQCLHRLEGHRQPVRGLALSPNGALLLSASDDATLRLWHVESGNPVKTFRDSGAGVTSVAFSPDGTLAVTGTDAGLVMLWDVGAGRQTDVLQGHTGPVWAVAFAPDCKTVASGSDDETIRLWAVTADKGESQAVIRGCSAPPATLAYSPAGDQLAACLLDCTAIVWSLRTGQEQVRLSDVSAVAWAESGHGLFTVGAEDDTVRLVDPTSGEELGQFGRPATAITTISISRNGKWLLAGDAGGTITPVDVSTSSPAPIRVKEAAVAVKEAPALGIVAPDEADYPSFDRSGLTDDAIRLVQEHVARHNNLDLKESDVARRMRDFLGNRSTESIRIARDVLAVWRRRNAGGGGVAGGASGAPDNAHDVAQSGAAATPLKGWQPPTLTPRGPAPVEVTLDIHCDIGCPWSYVGMGNLWMAMTGFPECSFALQFHPLLRDPDVPKDGLPAKQYKQMRWGDIDFTRPLLEDGPAVGCEFKEWTYWPNTLHAHRLVQYAQRHGQGEAVLKALFQAVFEVGLNLDLPVLLGVGAHFQLPGVERFLRSGDGEAAVREADARARACDIDSPPHFLVNAALPYVGTISVAQWTSILQGLVEEALARRAPDAPTMVLPLKPPRPSANPSPHLEP